MTFLQRPSPSLGAESGRTDPGVRRRGRGWSLTAPPIFRLFAAMKRRRAKAARATALARLKLAEQRRDSRSIHTARDGLRAATTDLLRAEMGRG
jgi:hypothetical protein